MPNIQDKCFLGRFGDFSLNQLFSNVNQWMHLGAAGCDSLIFWLPLTFARENELTSCVDTGQYYNVSGCCCLGEHQVPDGHKAIQEEEEWPTACCCFLPTKACQAPDLQGALVAIEPWFKTCARAPLISKLASRSFLHHLLPLILVKGKFGKN